MIEVDFDSTLCKDICLGFSLNQLKCLCYWLALQVSMFSAMLNGVTISLLNISVYLSVRDPLSTAIHVSGGFCRGNIDNTQSL